METHHHNYSRYLIQCRTVMALIDNHIKGSSDKIRSVFVSGIQIFFFYADPTPCDCKDLLEEMQTYLADQIAPALEASLDNNAEWWTLKENSSLRQLAESVGCLRLNQWFTPSTLITFIQDQSFRLNLHEAGNSSILNLNNSPLETCFKDAVLYVPDLYKHCLPHVNIVTHGNTLENLKHTAVKKEFYVETPSTLLFKDTSAQFWVPNIYNQIICKNKKVSYSWSELYQLFYDFFSHSNEHLDQLNNSLCMIKSTSDLSNHFNFNFLHKDQITPLLKQITKYLGKTSNLRTLCPKLDFNANNTLEPFMLWLENTIYTHYQHRSSHTLDLMYS